MENLKQNPYELGTGCLGWAWGDNLDPALTERVLETYRSLRDDPGIARIGVTDVVPAYTGLAVYFDPLQADTEGLIRRVESAWEAAGRFQSLFSPTLHRVRARYDGPDLDRVAQYCGLSRAEVVERHIAGVYRVAMIGFRPHFPYLLGLDPLLSTPRLDSPRTRVAAGSIGIGGAQTGIYSQDSPGGWNIIGSCDPGFLSQVKPGDSLQFIPLETE